ncbi:MAG: carbonate dehydratase [Ottowia sp.]|nr:carbonate dehydratase [Ottowia sp.]
MSTDNLLALFNNNRKWVTHITAQDPSYFSRLSQQQAPRYLWIGCSDSRVPANQIVGLEPGEMFVHRNIANVVAHSDLNCLSVMQFGVEVLSVEHIMVVGHYGCGGVGAAMNRSRVGLADNWLRHVQDVYEKHRTHLEQISDHHLRHDRFCELNVIEQVVNVCQTTIACDAWDRGQSLTIHGWVYGLADGLLRDLEISINSADMLAQRYQNSISKIRSETP